MHDTETRHEAGGHRPLGKWLSEETRLAIPRYWILVAACAAVGLLLVALD